MTSLCGVLVESVYVDPMFVAVGGLAVEKLGKLSAWGPCRCDIDPEKASPEHAHLRPSPTKEHEMEAPGPAGRIQNALSPKLSSFGLHFPPLSATRSLSRLALIGFCGGFKFASRLVTLDH